MNSIFEDTFPSSYSDKLVKSVISKFADLVLLARRIDDGIWKGKIMDVWVGMFEKKKNMLDGHIKGQDNEKSVAIERSVNNFSRMSPNKA